MADRVQRFDLGGIRSKPKRTPQGFMKMTGNLTRTGVLTYKTKDGRTVRELRHPEDVFDENSLESLSIAKVTDLHPPSMISEENVAEYGRGTVRSVEPLGKFITGEIIVEDAKLISKVTEGSRRELSPGYTCELEWGAGEYEGEKYDARQRNIVYNHLALGPQGWGRSGPEVSVHMDSAATEIGLFEGMTMQIKDNAETAEEQKEIAPEAVAEALAAEEAKAEPAAEEPKAEEPSETTTQEIEVQKTDDSKLSDVLAKLEKENAELRAKLDSANEFLKPEHFRRAVEKRVAVESSAKKVLGPEFKCDGLSEQEIYAAALKARGVSLEGKSEAYVEARFDAILETSGIHNIRQVRADAAQPVSRDIDPRALLIASQNKR